MRDAGIGRLLVAALHQSIADLLPARLEFYENWLNPIGLREGTIGLAPLAAVLSFLRREDGMYGVVTDRAGDYAAEWTIQGMNGVRRATIQAFPRPIRTRLVLGVARDLVRTTYSGSRAVLRCKGGRVTVDLRSSIFCGVRQPFPEPLCGFYAAAFRRVMTLFDLPMSAVVTRCRGMGDTLCVLSMSVEDGAVAPGTTSRAHQASESA
jgi:hypothetical protein